jgi:hypothetical protein
MLFDRSEQNEPILEELKYTILINSKWTSGSRAKYVFKLAIPTRSMVVVVVIVWQLDLQLPKKPLMLRVRISIRAMCTTLCDKICQRLATG